MAQQQHITFQGYLIVSEHTYQSDIGKWSVQCSITSSQGEVLGVRACPEPMYAASEEEAIRAGLVYGQWLVKTGRP
ncbi:hypothetical protein CDR19_09400 [Ectopseudomonas toyotomiensis]|uniref:Uncharacterized protein n=1 Tax=Ectopseudomonas toyotomiensis TaxID=554344 RepID=A0A1I5PGD6_9GAMM|nr:hypothetical protein CDR19_09400 [Pseudomonas toyotomiensis]SFP32611.1 hypothetical protein SAMN05216177_102285 [Pseudomonas toyotomiensis]